jgi:hypothetical protein
MNAGPSDPHERRGNEPVATASLTWAAHTQTADTRLVLVSEAWPTLPEAIRVAIVAMVESFRRG